MFFRQLFDRVSCTYSYLLADGETKEALLIDPVLEEYQRDVNLIEELGLSLKYTLETHIHADHITGAGKLRERFGCKIVVSPQAQADCADVLAEDGTLIYFGQNHLQVIATPGHTSSCISLLSDDASRVFTGDTLLIRGCGRTDFQQGSSTTLYKSVHEKLFTLDDATLVYPGHDYKGRTVSSIAEERRFNPRLGGDRTLDEFINLMNNLNLPQPQKIGIAVTANQQCGRIEAQPGQINE
tara:strand:+ start:516 stop:1235 length:720 start_codon:yes stop_codon:yes gene_type:complete